MIQNGIIVFTKRKKCRFFKIYLWPFSRRVAEARSMLFSPNFNVKMAGPASITGRYLLVPQEVVSPPLNNKKLDPFLCVCFF